jgi:putative iron-only hydrogenase system regulator
MPTDEKRIASVSILVRNRAESNRVNEILSRHGEAIRGRLGVPFREQGISVISVLLEADAREIGAIGGALGNIPGVTVRSVMLT